MDEKLVLAGIITIFVGMVLIIIGSMSGIGKDNVKFGFGGFIGPFPFGFANDPKILKLVISILILAFALILFSLLIRFRF